jgi:hypothetical protein
LMQTSPMKNKLVHPTSGHCPHGSLMTSHISYIKKSIHLTKKRKYNLC